MLNLDTHILIEFLAGKLSKKELEKLKGEEFAISNIVLWEIAKLKQLGRIEIDLESREMKRFFKRITKLPITVDIATQSTKLDINSDPADEIIAATSLVHSIPLMTRDKELKKSRLIECI